MKFSAPLIVVTDMARSRQFYETVLKLEVDMDLDGNIVFKNAHSIQDIKYWTGFIGRDDKDIVYGANNAELYFDEENFDAFLDHFGTFQGIELVNPVTEYHWGQRTIRFYDPDRHIVEVGESMSTVIRRFVSGGMTPEQTAQRTDHPLDYVLRCLEGEC